MTDSEPWNSAFGRRRFLRWAAATGVVSTAGCNADESPPTPPAKEPSTPTTTVASTPTPTDAPTETATASPSPTAQPREDTCAGTEPSVPSSADEWWPMYLHDRVNQQHNEATTGPTAQVGVAWAVETGGTVRSSPAVVEETVYIGSNDGRLYALDMSTGEEEWTFETDGPVVSSPAVVDGTVYIGSTDHTVYALDAETGTKEWVFETDGAVRSSPTVAETRQSSIHRLLAIGSDDGRLYLLNAETGDQRDVIYDGEPVVSTAALFHGRGPSVWYAFGSTSSIRYHGQAEKGLTQRYRRAFPGPIHSSVTTPFSPNSPNQAFFELFGTDEGTFHKFAEAIPPWRFDANGKIRSSPALANEVVYFGSSDHNLYAFEFSSGEERWRFETGGEVESSPAVADGVVYVGSGDQHVYALNTDSGEQLWAVRTGGAVYSSPAVVSGTVFVGSDDGFVYALTACR